MESNIDSDHERNERERKQTFLKQEIISKGYNKADFATYMNSIKENGVDIDVWTFDEIAEAVENFQISQNDLEASEKDEPSSEEDEMYRYLHPGEVEKIKQRNKKAKEDHRQSLLNQTKPVISHPLENLDPVANNSNAQQESNDQGGWEQDEISIEFLKVTSKDSTQDNDANIDLPASYEQNKDSLDENVKVEESSIPAPKSAFPIVQNDDVVEKALEDFFDNEEPEYEVIEDKAQGSISENEEAKQNVIKKMTPPPKPNKAIQKPISRVQENKVESFIADVKVSKETKLLLEPKIDIKVLDAKY